MPSDRENGLSSPLLRTKPSPEEVRTDGYCGTLCVVLLMCTHDIDGRSPPAGNAILTWIGGCANGGCCCTRCGGAAHSLKVIAVMPMPCHYLGITWGARVAVKVCLLVASVGNTAGCRAT